MFHRFLELPPELREMVWQLCLPHRVWEIDKPSDEFIWFFRHAELNGLPAPAPCRLEETTQNNARPPTIAYVCRESRSVAFKAARLRATLEDEGDPQSLRWDRNKPWVDHARGTPHIYWSRPCEPFLAIHNNPVKVLSEQVSRFQDSCGSLMLSLLDRNYSGDLESYLYNPESGESDDEEYEGSYSSDDGRPAVVLPPDPELCPDVYNDITALLQQPKWLIIMRIIIVHVERGTAAATGLFGLLGDAPIQIVDISDEERMEALYDLAEAWERKADVDIKQDFQRHSRELMRRRLQDALYYNSYLDELLSRMRPAIMFRLCTQMCNHR